MIYHTFRELLDLCGSKGQPLWQVIVENEVQLSEISADMALGGMKSIIPCDQVVEAMAKVGRMLPMELRETALGGVAATAAGKAYTKEIFGL